MSGGGGPVVGCSGYDYPEWRGPFYPDDLPRREWFDHYASRFGGVEINNTFYNLPEASTFDAWRERAPKGFVHALKLSRYGTHMKRLRDPADWLGAFLEGADRLGDRLGPILAQLPPRWGVDVDRLRGFLEAAPERCRWAVEFRDADWLRDEVYDVLGEHDAALVIHDLIEDHPRVTPASWVYLRYHGTGESGRYSGAYTCQKLTADAQQIAGWIGEGREVFAFFNNDVGAQAPRDAQRLIRYTGSALETARAERGA